MSDATTPRNNTRAPVQENSENGRGARFWLYGVRNPQVLSRLGEPYRRVGGGFTLIELLVVIAVISLLAAILLPVFAKAKSNAKQTNCLANLKQLAAAWQAYADDSAGRACVSYYYSPDYRFEYAWDTVLDWSKDPPTSKLGLLGKFTRSGRINCCPSFKGESFGRPFTGYAYNATYIGGDGAARPACLLSQIARPTQTVVLADAGWGSPVSSEAYLRAPSDSLFIAGKVHFRHQGWANVAYADGHVRATNKIFRYDEAEPECGALSDDDSAYDLK